MVVVGGSCGCFVWRGREVQGAAADKMNIGGKQSEVDQDEAGDVKNIIGRDKRQEKRSKRKGARGKRKRTREKRRGTRDEGRKEKHKAEIE